jgi:exosortase
MTDRPDGQLDEVISEFRRMPVPDPPDHSELLSRMSSPAAEDHRYPFVAGLLAIVGNLRSGTAGRAFSTKAEEGSPPARDSYSSRAWRWALGAVAVLLAWAYAANFRDLSTTWAEDPNYSHGFLVVPIALFILGRRLAEMPWEPSREAMASPGWSGALLAAILLLRAVAYERGYSWLETATLLPAVACLTWAFGGWPLMRRAWPAILFLVFMLPLPNAVNALIAMPLQRLAATGSGILLQLVGFWVVQNGNVLHLSTPYGIRPLDVALACNGLRMLMCLGATVTATILLLPLPSWKRLTLLFSAVPIAILSNMLRILATGFCYYFFQGRRAEEWAHDISGWLMMPMALALVGLELGLLAWLVPEEEAGDDRKSLLLLLSEKGPARSKPGSPDLGEL